MSTYKVEVIRVTGIRKHDNADTLSLAEVFGNTTVFRTQDFKEGDLAAYLPLDSLPSDEPELAFLKGKRVKAARLRGVYSEGVLIPARPGWAEGQDVTAELRCTKYEESEDVSPAWQQGKAKKGRGWRWDVRPSWFHKYTDVQQLGRHQHLLEPGETVVAREKAHGCNAVYAYADRTPPAYFAWFFAFIRFLTGWAPKKLWISSRNVVMADDGENMWSKASRQNNLEEKCRRIPGFVVYGEVYGSKVQDLEYNALPGQLKFRAFDAYDIAKDRFLSNGEFEALMKKAGIPVMPVVYEGPFLPDELKAAVETRSILADMDHVAGRSYDFLFKGETDRPAAAPYHIMEGVVVRPLEERVVHHFGRVVLKLVSQQYKLRGGGEAANKEKKRAQRRDRIPVSNGPSPAALEAAAEPSVVLETAAATPTEYK